MPPVEGSLAQHAVEVLDRVLQARLEEFPRALMAALAEVIPVLFAGYYEVDPRIPRIHLEVHPEDFDYPEELRRRGAELQAEHPLARHHYATGYGGAMRISDVMSAAEHHGAPIYRDLHSRLGVEHQMAFRLPGPEPLRLVVALSRSDRDFSDAERDLCNLLREPLAAAHALAVRTSLLHDTVRDYTHTDPHAALIACDGNALIPLDTTAEPLLSRLLDPTGTPLPELTTWLQHARAGDTVLSDPLPNRHLTTWTDHHGSLEIRHVPGTDGHDLLAVRQLERDIPTTLQALGLRPREAQVLELVMTGRTNHDIATELHITTATVKKHLEHIYRTLDVSTRTAAAATAYHAITGTTPAGDD
jgi:DNA-binding CsgD family transcriptional regulator